MKAGVSSDVGPVASLPVETVEWIGRFFTASQSGVSAKIVRRMALRHLYRWRQGREDYRVPGYDEPPEDAQGKRFPRGWSYGTFVAVRRAIDMTPVKCGQRTTR